MEHLIFHYLFQYKGKGILVFPILIASVLLVMVPIEILMDKDLFWKYLNKGYLFGLSFWVAGIWLWFIKDSYYTNEEGEKVLLAEIENSFWFMPLHYWSYIFGVVGGMILIETYV